MNNISDTVISIFGAVATLYLFYQGMMTVLSAEITVRARHTRPHVVNGPKAVVIGLGMVGTSICIGLAFYFGIKAHSITAPVAYLALGAGVSSMIGFFLAIFLPGTVKRKHDDGLY